MAFFHHMVAQAVAPPKMLALAAYNGRTLPLSYRCEGAGVSTEFNQVFTDRPTLTGITTSMSRMATAASGYTYAVDPDGTGTLWRRSGGGVWSNITPDGASYFWHDVDAFGSTVLISGSGKLVTGEALYYSTNSGATWTLIPNLPGGSTGGSAIKLIGSVIYVIRGVGDNRTVHYTTDLGASWVQQTGQFAIGDCLMKHSPSGAWVYAIGYAAGANKFSRWAGQGGANTGQATTLSVAQAIDRRLTDIAVNPRTGTIVLVGNGVSLFSINDGSTFQVAAAGVPANADSDTPRVCCYVGPTGTTHQNGTFFLLSKSGIYFSTDGSIWTYMMSHNAFTDFNTYDICALPGNQLGN